MRIDEITALNPLEIESTITNQCSLIQKSNIELYRGVSGKPAAFISDIRVDRRTMTSSKFQIELFDFLMKVNNLPHRKSNTLSVSVSANQAESYGSKLYRIYPMDGMHYVWANPRDLLSLPMSIVYFHRKANNLDLNNPIYSSDLPEIQAFITENLDEVNEYLGLTETTDPSTINRDGEIVLFGAKYLGVFEKENF